MRICKLGNQPTKLDEKQWQLGLALGGQGEEGGADGVVR